MANFDMVQKNRLIEEMNWQAGTGLSRAVLFTAISVNLFIALINVKLWVVSIPLTLIICAMMTTRSGYRNYDPIKAAGAEGEESLLSRLARLPDSYQVANQLIVPDPSSAYGKREIDFLVYGNDRLYVVECKNYNGYISGSADDAKWHLHKVGRGGTSYSSAVTNPVRQVRRQAAALRKYLAGAGIIIPVVPIVALAGGNSTAGINSPRLPVIQASALADHICADATGAKADLAVMAKLAELRRLTFNDLPTGGYADNADAAKIVNG